MKKVKKRRLNRTLHISGTFFPEIALVIIVFIVYTVYQIKGRCFPWQ